jgi:3-hydroxyacyl-[acyl-carrier-protein] dehydratase
MPGVLMLQTLVEAGAWLIRLTEDFRHSVIVLREAKNVKYGHFMEPGRQMLATAELVDDNGTTASFKARGDVEGSQVVSARVFLSRYNLGERDSTLKAIDERIVAHWRGLYATLRGDLSQTIAASG